MKKILAIILSALFLFGCSNTGTGNIDVQNPDSDVTEADVQSEDGVAFKSRFESERKIVLSDEKITLDGEVISDSGDVFVSNDIIYYEDKESYESGLTYGEGETWEKHTAEQAQANTVVNITQSGAYRISGKLSKGQIRVDLGDDAYENPDAVVELIFDGADITCDVAPAILFMNVYECDGEWSAENAKSEVDTSKAGAVIALEKGSVNNISGSHVAKIFKDKEGEKKLWKQDGAVYSYMSMNVFGPGTMNITADNEGLDTELHLTINGGNINIYSQNDGINTNEDGVSVTTINGGNLRIVAGLGAEGDGIDSNGYLVINGGTVVSSANPGADAGLDSDLGSFVNGGTVVALGSTMDWAESDSEQVTVNLQFAGQQSSDSSIVFKDMDGKVIFAYSPAMDENAKDNMRVFSGAIISSSNFELGAEYELYIGGSIVGEEKGGIYDVETITAYQDGIKQGYTGTDVRGGFGGGRPQDFGGKLPDMPEGEVPQMPDGEMPQMPGGERPEMPDGEMPQLPDGERPQRPDGERQQMPEGEFTQKHQGRFPGGFDTEASGNAERMTVFYMADKVNMFSGISAADAVEDEL